MLPIKWSYIWSSRKVWNSFWWRRRSQASWVMVGLVLTGALLSKWKVTPPPMADHRRPPNRNRFAGTPARNATRWKGCDMTNDTITSNTSNTITTLFIYEYWGLLAYHLSLASFVIEVQFKVLLAIILYFLWLQVCVIIFLYPWSNFSWIQNVK